MPRNTHAEEIENLKAEIAARDEKIAALASECLQDGGNPFMFLFPVELVAFKERRLQNERTFDNGTVSQRLADVIIFLRGTDRGAFIPNANIVLKTFANKHQALELQMPSSSRNNGTVFIPFLQTEKNGDTEIQFLEWKTAIADRYFRERTAAVEAGAPSFASMSRTAAGLTVNSDMLAKLGLTPKTDPTSTTDTPTT